MPSRSRERAFTKEPRRRAVSRGNGRRASTATDRAGVDPILLIARTMQTRFLLGLFSLITLAACRIDANASSGSSSDSSSAPVESNGNTVEVASFPNEATVDVVSDGTNAFVTTVRNDAKGGRVVRIEPSGTVLTLAQTSDAPWALVADDTYVYFATRGSGVSRVAKTGADAPFALSAPNTYAAGVAVAGGNVYYTSVDGVHRVSTSGGDDALFAADPHGPDAIVADGSAVYWLDRGTVGETGSIMRADASTGAVTRLADGLSLDALSTFTLAQDATSLYFPDNAGHRVYRIRKTDGDATTITTVDAPIAVAVDDTNVYVATQSNSGNDRGIISVSKSSVGTSTMVYLANTAQTGGYAIAVDASNLWFTNYVTTGGVYRLAKVP
jgi:hypothetical protein